LIGIKRVIENLEELAYLLLTDYRRRHLFSVRDFSLMLAEKHDVDPTKCEIAAISHDLFRDVNSLKLLRMAKAYRIEINHIERVHPVLLHGKVSAEFLRRRFGIEDEEILYAVAYHTSGHVSFDKIGKILFVSDSVEMTRDYPGVDELRRIAMMDLEEAFFQVLKNKITYAVRKDYLLLPETVEVWNKVVSLRGGKLEEEE